MDQSELGARSNHKTGIELIRCGVDEETFYDFTWMWVMGKVDLSFGLSVNRTNQ